MRKTDREITDLNEIAGLIEGCDTLRLGFNDDGCPYIVQRAAEGVHTPEGKKQVMETVHGYLENARVLVSAMKGLGLSVYGGVNAPYIWVSTPDGMDSWSFFDHLLHKASLVCTPGAGFGQSGEGYVRLTAFGTPEDTAEAIRRLQSL